MMPFKYRKDQNMFIDQESRKKICRSLFSYLGENPGSWLLSSSRLKKSADTLRDTCWPKEKKHHDLNAATADFRIGPVYMLLMGMAIEDALKAIIVASNGECIGDQRISKDFATHHLKDLWGWAGLNRVKSRQRDSLLDRLESFVITFGRYPVSSTKHKMNTMIGSSFHGETDFDKVNRLWVFLEKHLKKAIPTLFEKKNSKQDFDKC
jgi:hypothetical protein